VTPSLVNQPRHVAGQNELTTFSAINLILGKTMGVGVYSVPSSVFMEVGSVGMTLVVWLLGTLISFCGLSVYLDLGTALPRSGGERVYLERIFRRPKMLATCMFLAYVVLLGFSTPNCVILGRYAIAALGFQPDVWNVRGIAIFVISLACLIHAKAPSTGLRIINVLGVGKMLILAGVILSGLASIGRVQASSGSSSVSQQNFSSIWAGTSSKPYNYATALLQVLYCFRGYNTANQVISEVRNPIPTIKVAAPVALTLASLGYLLANVAYFCAVEKDDFRSSGVVVASHFLRNIFGTLWGERILPCFIIISAFGNIAATSFAQARVNQELGVQGLLPRSDFWRKKNAVGAPAPGLFLHWLVSVLVIVLPPPGEIYTFLVQIGGYPVSVLSVAIAGGLLYLQASPKEQWQSPCPAPKLHTLIFFTANALLLVFPWIDPGRETGRNKRFAYYAYPATSLAILGLGVVYWLFWRRSQEPGSPMVGTPLLEEWSVDGSDRNSSSGAASHDVTETESSEEMSLVSIAAPPVLVKDLVRKTTKDMDK
jgi:amino acid transporter